MHPLKEKMIDKITDMPPEMVEVVDKHFWGLIDNPQPATEASSGAVPGYVFCKKCGDKDILTRFVEAGKHITASSQVKVENEFISSSQHDFYYTLMAKKEHLTRHCRNCQYEWLENTLDT